MSRVLYGLTARLLRAMPVDAAGRRVFEETLADWRAEALGCSNTVGRLSVALRGLFSAVRSIALVSWRELGSGDGLATLGRLAVWSVAALLALVVLHSDQRTIPVRGSSVEAGPAAVWLLALSSLVVYMPVLAFLSAAFGRKTLATPPRLGPVLLVSGVMLAVMGWVLPEINQAYRQIVLERLVASAGEVTRGFSEYRITELVGRLVEGDSWRAAFELNTRLLFVVAVPTLLALGTTVRFFKTRRRVAGVVLVLLLIAAPVFLSAGASASRITPWAGLLAAVLAVKVLAAGASRDRDGDRLDANLTQARS